MANAVALKKLGHAFSNEVRMAKLTYDFSVDGGAVGTYVLANVDQKMLILNAIVQVEEACTSGGSATVKIGSSVGNDDAFLDVTSGAVASLTDDATVIETTAAGLIIGSTEDINLVIGTAALTAGKINVFLQYVNVV